MRRSFLLPLFALSLLLMGCGAAKESLRSPKGSPNATVLVEEFADLQCPACRAAHTQISGPLLDKYGDRIRFEHKHFPLRQIHRFALDLAEMSECAAAQEKFWEFVDIAFEKQSELEADVWLAWGDTIGLKRAQAEKCMASHEWRKTALADYKEGRERGVSGTPTYFVNGIPVETGFDTLSAAIEEALKGATMRL